MSQILAIDWDRNEVRYVIGSVTGPRLKIRSLGATPIDRSAEPDEQVATAVRSVLSQLRPGRRTVLVGLPRADIDVLSMTLPPARDVELPELVAHEVLRQSPQLAEDATIDFVSLTDNAQEPRIVAAAVCPAEQIRRIRTECDRAGLTANRILIRPFALPALLDNVPAGPSSNLLVCRVGCSIDLAVVAGGKVVYARTVKLPEEVNEAATAERLLEEINRTVVVGPQNLVTGEPIERVYLVGDATQQFVLAEQLDSQMSIPVELVDPFGEIRAARQVDDTTLDRFGPLLGMIRDETKKRHAIDFLAPRKPPPPPNRRRQLTIAGMIAAVLIAIGAYYVWDELNTLQSEYDKKAAELRDLNELLNKAKDHRRLAESIETWEARNVNWLDEMRDFCERFPTSRDALVLHMSLTPSRSGGGEIDLNGLVRDPAIVLRMENSIRDDFHTVQRKRVQESVQEKAYSWHFDSTVTVRPKNKKQYLADFLKENTSTEEPLLAAGEEVTTLPVATSNVPDSASERRTPEDARDE